ncbi:MAG: ABC transporter permease [Anaerolineae bacterium]|nr:ABC transporter permease [Anaerolineae bacterium]NUQ06731.1 ABC transporter permease [Anaerolineae bacterium]
MSEDSLKLTPGQASDAEAASEAVYAEAVDVVFDDRTLGLDMLAAAAIFFVMVCAHLQNPLLTFGTPFGSAFRNATLQPVMAAGLLICLLALTRPYWLALLDTEGRARLAKKHREEGLPAVLGWAASGVLALYGLYSAAAILFGFNLSGALVGLPQSVFTERLSDAAPVESLQNALNLITPLVWLAAAAVIVLWQPWRRLPVYRRALRKQGAALLIGAMVILAWELLINIFQIQQFLLPKPSVIANVFAEVYPRLVSAGWNTFQNGFWGFVVGCGAGVLTGIAASRFVSFSRALLPVAIAVNAIPIIALAPLMNNWFGALNPASKIGIVALLTYFPTMVSTVRGLTSVEVTSLELMKTYAATELTIFRKLRMPSALPFIFSALKVCTTLAMIGAIVSEYFGGSTAGIGFRIRDDAGLFKYPEAWSAILISALYGILFYLVVSAIERVLMSWHVSFRES